MKTVVDTSHTLCYICKAKASPSAIRMLRGCCAEEEHMEICIARMHVSHVWVFLSSLPSLNATFQHCFLDTPHTLSDLGQLLLHTPLTLLKRVVAGLHRFFVELLRGCGGPRVGRLIPSGDNTDYSLYRMDPQKIN